MLRSAIEDQHLRPPVDLPGDLCRAVVGVVADYTGRGPTRIRVTLGQDVMCVVMRDNHTKGERALLSVGEHDLVAELRRAYHRAMHDALIVAARDVSGREVEAVLADHSPDPDVSTFNFVLAPLPATTAPVARPSSAAPVDGSAEPALTLRGARGAGPRTNHR